MWTFLEAISLSCGEAFRNRLVTQGSQPDRGWVPGFSRMSDHAQCACGECGTTRKLGPAAARPVALASKAGTFGFWRKYPNMPAPSLLNVQAFQWLCGNDGFNKEL